jgi:hypothetical protein
MIRRAGNQRRYYYISIRRSLFVIYAVNTWSFKQNVLRHLHYCLQNRVIYRCMNIVNHLINNISPIRANILIYTLQYVMGIIACKFVPASITLAVTFCVLLTEVWPCHDFSSFSLTSIHTFHATVVQPEIEQKPWNSWLLTEHKWPWYLLFKGNVGRLRCRRSYWYIHWNARTKRSRHSIMEMNRDHRQSKQSLNTHVHKLSGYHLRCNSLLQFYTFHIPCIN